MGLGAFRGGRAAGLAAAAFVAGLGLAGCNKQGGGGRRAPRPRPRAARRWRPSRRSPRKPSRPRCRATPAAPGLRRRHPPGRQPARRRRAAARHDRRPDKPVGKLYTEVVRLWDDIRFVDAGRQADRLHRHPRHRPRRHRDRPAARRGAQPRPQLRGPGPGRLLRRPAFDRIHHDESDATRPQAAALDQIEAGCPLGHRRPGATAASATGSSRRRDRRQDRRTRKAPSAPATATEPDSAGCKFYITLCKRPVPGRQATPSSAR